MAHVIRTHRFLFSLFLALMMVAAVVSLAGAQDEVATQEVTGEEGPLQPGSTYTVQPGDTLDVLAQRWNVSLISLMRHNDITDPLELRPGDVLVVPTDGFTYGQFPPLEDVSAGAGGGVEGDIYVVQPRDTLETIGQSLNVSVVSLQLANDITDARKIQPGDVLVIPADAPPYGVYPATDTGSAAGLGTGGPVDTSAGAGGGIAGETYVVQPNDTLDTIAQRLDVSLISLQRANDVTNSKRLFPGTTLIIPEGAPPYGVYPPLEDPASQDSTLGQGGGGNIYVVQVADTLDTIAAENNLQIQCLVDANQLEKPHRIYPGQMLVLDATCPPYEGSLMPVAPASAPEPVATEESPAG